MTDSKSIAKSRHIWWKIRPHIDYGTVEFRMCDAQRDISRVKMLAAICQALVYQAVQDFENNILKEEFDYELLLDSLWKASRFGFDAQIKNFNGPGIISIKNSIYELYIENCAHKNDDILRKFRKNILCTK